MFRCCAARRDDDPRELPRQPAPAGFMYVLVPAPRQPRVRPGQNFQIEVPNVGPREVGARIEACGRHPFVGHYHPAVISAVPDRRRGQLHFTLKWDDGHPRDLAQPLQNLRDPPGGRQETLGRFTLTMPRGVPPGSRFVAQVPLPGPPQGGARDPPPIRERRRPPPRNPAAEPEPEPEPAAPVERAADPAVIQLPGSSAFKAKLAGLHQIISNLHGDEGPRRQALHWYNVRSIIPSRPSKPPLRLTLGAGRARTASRPAVPEPPGQRAPAEQLPLRDRLPPAAAGSRLPALHLQGALPPAHRPIHIP